jgi:hypothetical protein
MTNDALGKDQIAEVPLTSNKNAPKICLYLLLHLPCAIKEWAQIQPGAL